MQVGELCVRDVQATRPEATVREATELMERGAVGTLVVVDPLRRPLGILTDRDVALRCVGPHLDPRRTRVEAVMSGPVAWIHAEAAIDDALEEMARLRVRRLVVVDARERLAGMLALDDVLCARLDAGSTLQRVLRATM